MRILTLLFLLIFALPAAAQPVRTPRVEVELVAERTAIEPGRALTVALRLAANPGWHTYWRNPGDSGEPTRIEWTLPQGFVAGPIRWPHPHKLPAGPLMNYGYEGEVLLLTDIMVPSQLPEATPIVLGAKAAWLVCNPERCIPEEADLRLEIGSTVSASTSWAQAIERTRAMLPVPAADHGAWRIEAAPSTTGMVLHIAPPQGIAPKAMQFFPYEEGKVEYAAAQPLTREDDALRLEIPAARQAIGAWTRVAGLLVADAPLAASGMQAIEIDVPVGAASVASDSVELGFAAALVLAFGGGLLLNLMPCVLPVLSIKILGIAQYGGHRKHGLIYGLGVLVSFWVLAAVLLALKAGGESLGWGFQLQSPLFVAMLALLFFTLALNLSGVFEFGSLVPRSLLGARASSPAWDAFLGGVLAVVVASPCTAPFMGAALGYALATDALSSIVVFTALGVGMALPFVLLAWHPGWLARLPRAGAWMVRLKQFLAFPLYGTVVWLAWVLGVQAGLEAVIVLLAALVTLSVGAWLLGISFERACLGRIAAAAFVVGALVLVAPLERSEAASPLSRSDDAWEPWSHERIVALSAQGRPVFVDFTAAWCVTCQVNKRLVLSQPDVEQAFRDRGVALLRADWTRRDPAIAAALAGFGRSGVPVYVLYRPGGEPRLLPEILTREGVIDALADFPRRKESS